MSQIIRRSDVAGRIDGQTFGLILIGSSAKNSWETCRRIQARFETEAREKEDFPAGLIFGISDGKLDSNTQASNLIQEAKEALKKAGARQGFVQ
jgi:GGDEF domain-containing protein